MKSTRLSTHCPRCQHAHTHATNVFHDVRPKAGDVTVCVGCGAFLAFDEALQLRELAPLEFAQLPEEIRQELGLVAATLYEAKGGRFS